MSLLFKGSGSVIDFAGRNGATVTGPWPVVDPGMPLSSGPRAFEIYSTQPSVRKVVEFVARNVARVHIQAFEGLSFFGFSRVELVGIVYLSPDSVRITSLSGSEKCSPKNLI